MNLDAQPFLETVGVTADRSVRIFDLDPFGICAEFIGAEKTTAQRRKTRSALDRQDISLRKTEFFSESPRCKIVVNPKLSEDVREGVGIADLTPFRVR